MLSHLNQQLQSFFACDDPKNIKIAYTGYYDDELEYDDMMNQAHRYVISAHVFEPSSIAKVGIIYTWDNWRTVQEFVRSGEELYQEMLINGYFYADSYNCKIQSNNTVNINFWFWNMGFNNETTIVHSNYHNDYYSPERSILNFTLFVEDFNGNRFYDNNNNNNYEIKTTNMYGHPVNVDHYPGMIEKRMY